MTLQHPLVRSSYAALLDLHPLNEHGEPSAYVILKRRFEVKAGACIPIAPEPLLHDFNDPSAEPRLHPGTDFWPYKTLTDVVVEGSAHPNKPDQREMTTTLRVGKVEKRIRVLGKRTARMRDGKVVFSESEPLTPVTLDFTNAYGGIAPNVVPVGPTSIPQALSALLGMDHPGAYPRNPFGKGYAVGELHADEIELPQLEDPDDLLTPERLLVTEPAHWWKQPLPWSLGWVAARMFPRFVHFAGTDEDWFPAPADELLAEVRRGLLGKGFRDGPRSVREAFYQEASLGLSLQQLTQGAPISLEGARPEGERLALTLPAPPKLTVEIATTREAVKPALHSLILRPEANELCLVYGAVMKLPRRFIPGIHKKIPIALSVDGDEPIRYVTPPTIHDQLVAAGLR